jgi:hypothetical protein
MDPAMLPPRRCCYELTVKNAGGFDLPGEYTGTIFDTACMHSRAPTR